jgi:hypothetical protein
MNSTSTIGTEINVGTCQFGCREGRVSGDRNQSKAFNCFLILREEMAEIMCSVSVPVVSDIYICSFSSGEVTAGRMAV